TERHHERTGRKRADGFLRLADRLDVVVIPGVLRKRNVQIGAETGASAALMRISPYIGIEEDGIGMDRNRENVGAFVEDALRAVAMMHVDIEYSDPLVLQLKFSRRDCAVVKKAESAGEIAVGMMTGRPAERVAASSPSITSRAAVVATSVAAQAAAQVPGPIGHAVSAACQPRRPTICVGYVAAWRTGCTLAIISGPASPRALQASH